MRDWSILSKYIKVEDIFDKFKSQVSRLGEGRALKLPYRSEAHTLRHPVSQQGARRCAERGKKSEITFHDDSVPRNNRTVPDTLKSEEMFPTSDLTYFAAGHKLSNEAVLDLDMIFDNFCTDRGSKFLSLYGSASSTFNDIDDHLICHLLLMSFHTAMLPSETCYERGWLLFFKAPVKTEVLSKVLPKLKV